MTIFMTMLYVFVVVPGILEEAGLPRGPITVAIILISGLTTIVMGLYSNRPFALAPGLGSVAFLSITLVVTEGLPWETGMGMVFILGVFFVLFMIFVFFDFVFNL